MKRIFIILVSPVSVFCLAQQALAPPNGAYIDEGLFMDKTEISNISWLEFLSSVRLDSGEYYYQQMLPDTTVWLDSDPMSTSHTYYLANWVFRFYPVVGISHEQATEYCKWRMAVVNRRIQNDPAFQEIRFRFRLPSEEEWEKAASGGFNAEAYPYGYRSYEAKTTLIDDYRFYWNQIQG